MWTIGREREKSHSAKFVRDEEQQRLLFLVIDAVHDIKEQGSGIQNFMSVARTAMIKGGSGVWQNTANWMRKVVLEYPDVSTLWDELAEHERWRVRWKVACCLYFDVPEAQSNRLFAFLRGDRSKKVRNFAVSRYEYRPDKRGVIEKRFDATQFRS